MSFEAWEDHQAWKKGYTESDKNWPFKKKKSDGKCAYKHYGL